MATPNIGSGVLERNKPLRLGSQVVYRVEAVLGVNGSFTTPIFDVVSDGWPYTEVEIGAFSVVRVPSRVFSVFVNFPSSDGMRLAMYNVLDNGSQGVVEQVYIPLPDAQGSAFVFVAPGRRCQFRLLNTPLTSGATAATTQFEVVSEG